ncbi:hypothetical protein GGQ19_000195 [Salinibacter ruber]|nr:hypothetical protein [Salinibacter ruber]MCS3939289.1 hypothetical protein [Salinibacter ruber]
MLGMIVPDLDPPYRHVSDIRSQIHTLREESYPRLARCPGAN